MPDGVAVTVVAGGGVSESSSVTVALGGLEPAVGRGLAQALGAAGLDVLAADLEAHVLEKVVAQRVPQVVILGEEVEYALLARLKSKMPTTGVLVIAHDPSRLSGTTLLAAGATCLDRAASTADLLTAIHLAVQGTLLFVSADGQRIERRAGSRSNQLTRRELQVFHQLSKGRSYAQIALELRIGYETVRTHSGRICKKLNVKSRQELTGMRLPTERDDEQHWTTVSRV
ncbi:MAG: helix-turn-helix transcriptional regulator [Solirubrobacteraceae bacterium]